MLDTEFRAPGGELITASSLAVGSRVKAADGTTQNVTWCRRLPRGRRLLVELHTKPLTLTGTHRVMVPGGADGDAVREVEAKALREGHAVLIGNSQQRLVKVSKYYKNVPCMEVEFENDSIIEVHAPSILTKGSDPRLPLDVDNRLKVKDEPMDHVEEAGEEAPVDAGYYTSSDDDRFFAH